MTILQLENNVHPTVDAQAQIRRLLKAEARLAALINELEPHRAEMPAGAFQHLTTAENLLQVKRSKLEMKDGGR